MAVLQRIQSLACQGRDQTFERESGRSKRKRVTSQVGRQVPWCPREDLHCCTTPKPGRFKSAVLIMPSWTRKIPGNLFSQGLLALGTYSRAFASTAATPGTCAASPTECTRDAPGQVRS